MSKKMFLFDRKLPHPFDTVSKSSTTDVSTYSDGTKATITAGVTKALLAYCKLADGSGQGALGSLDQKLVCEYKSTEADKYHIVVFDTTTRKFLASVYDTNTDNVEQYVISKSGRDAAALFLALFPILHDDAEFQEKLTEFEEHHRAGFADLKGATGVLAVLCDNVYRRMTDETCTAHVKADVEATGNLTRISTTHLLSKTFMPKDVQYGEFIIFAQSAKAPAYHPMTTIPHTDFEGQYHLNAGRILSPHEMSMVPALQSWYILPEQVVSVCKHAAATTGKNTPMRNFLLRGPAGTGKTEGAKAVAAGLHLPYVLYTCSANSEIYDFIGQMFPDGDQATTGDAELDEQRQQLQAMGGITYENVSKLMGLPGLDDMDYDPEGTYLALTGTARPGVSSQECMAQIMTLITDKLKQLCTVKPDSIPAGQTYSYVETDFIRALKHGWVCEIQEPTTIMQPGVLVGLNSLLEQNGTITLPTGEIIRRHPDAVIVITTNTSYEGCRGMNQSVLDRMSLVHDMELPSPEVMAQRAMSVTGCDDDAMVVNMVQVVSDMADFCRKNAIADGSVGMRSLIDWIISTEITGDPYLSALITVVSKASSDDEDRYKIMESVLNPIFAPSRAYKSA